MGHGLCFINFLEGSMNNLINDIKILPRFCTQLDFNDPVVFIKLKSQDGNSCILITEGEPKGFEYSFYGYIKRGRETEWGYVDSSQLNYLMNNNKIRMRPETSFKPQKFSEVVRHL